jgi:hypothetical protein
VRVERSQAEVSGVGLRERCILPGYRRGRSSRMRGCVRWHHGLEYAFRSAAPEYKSFIHYLVFTLLRPLRISLEHQANEFFAARSRPIDQTWKVKVAHDRSSIVLARLRTMPRGAKFTRPGKGSEPCPRVASASLRFMRYYAGVLPCDTSVHLMPFSFSARCPMPAVATSSHEDPATPTIDPGSVPIHKST